MDEDMLVGSAAGLCDNDEVGLADSALAGLLVGSTVGGAQLCLVGVPMGWFVDPIVGCGFGGGVQLDGRLVDPMLGCDIGDNDTP